jgi:heat shock protein HspQ
MTSLYISLCEDRLVRLTADLHEDQITAETIDKHVEDPDCQTESLAQAFEETRTEPTRSRYQH